MLVVGAGHVAVALAEIAHQSGFQVIIQDERTEFATSQRFPQAAQLFAQPIGETLAYLAPYAVLYVALVTRRYQQDLEALQFLLQQCQTYEYIGLIGSEKRIRIVRHTLQKQGVSIKKLEQLYAPIGLDIGALTPEEIAVSICAELIKVRRGGTGLSLSELIDQANTNTHSRQKVHSRSLV